ncbi:MAG: T9SS type A sorting domain-containing protein, partial [Bacteroidales bacterium]|nr:T9SS type A sorting domain-containing protein [Bacteroidales bacterium]
APCAGVESVAADRGMGSATLRWRGGEGQQLWQVARVAADSTGREPDSAAWEQALLTETADTVLTLALDTCVWLRVRGMCDEGHYGPWSAAVVACPLVGIASGAEAGGVVLTPNPASGLVAVADALSGTPLHGVREVQVVSALGTTVLSTKGSAYFSVNALPAGTYFVKAATRRGTYLLKLVVEH